MYWGSPQYMGCLRHTRKGSLWSVANFGCQATRECACIAAKKQRWLLNVRCTFWLMAVYFVLCLLLLLLLL